MWSNIQAGLGPARPKEGTTWFRAGLDQCFSTSAGTARPKNLLGFAGPNPFVTKHDGLGPGWPGPAQFPVLHTTVSLYWIKDQSSSNVRSTKLDRRIWGGGGGLRCWLCKGMYNLKFFDRFSKYKRQLK